MVSTRMTLYAVTEMTAGEVEHGDYGVYWTVFSEIEPAKHLRDFVNSSTKHMINAHFELPPDTPRYEARLFEFDAYLVKVVED